MLPQNVDAPSPMWKPWLWLGVEPKTFRIMSHARPNCVWGSDRKGLTGRVWPEGHCGISRTTLETPQIQGALNCTDRGHGDPTGITGVKTVTTLRRVASQVNMAQHGEDPVNLSSGGGGYTHEPFVGYFQRCLVVHSQQGLMLSRRSTDPGFGPDNTNLWWANSSQRERSILATRPSIAILEWLLHPAGQKSQDQSGMAGIAQVLFFFHNWSNARFTEG